MGNGEWDCVPLDPDTMSQQMAAPTCYQVNIQYRHFRVKRETVFHMERGIIGNYVMIKNDIVKSLT